MTINALAKGIVECYKNGMESFVVKSMTFQKWKELLYHYILG
jgi:hypothetical protein